MVQPAQSSSPEDPDKPARRLSSDEPLWEREPERAPAPPAPGGRRPLWRRALRVDLLLVGVAVALLVVGFLLGLAVGGDGDRPAPAPSPPASASTVAPATVTSVITVAGPPPPSCRDAIEAAERAIAYLVANARDDRLTRAIQEFTAQRRACLRATR